MGLRYDDLLMEENFQMTKALSRLSDLEAYDRAYRFRRASQCSVLHKDLPKDQWTTVEEDVRYVTPLLEEIQKADDEREAWDTMKVKIQKAH
ncbi:Cytochrome b-c1 complex subunit 7 [Malassezia vespertilionis]|uniref:Cytochrome b-c1 complex subunit 7 n=1 Tax=Malassezia vespertilionis TaxID=2020962 RepID=UPI0024B1A99E|nr:Cytochrome b-c1 complex subunit 7 [Malassezia vespertilionis]WFD05957.1 Cytochrome b-c1 complex subunit 7 [Malassezia vespertilionis]